MKYLIEIIKDDIGGFLGFASLPIIMFMMFVIGG